VGSDTDKRIVRNVVDAVGSLLTALLVFGATPTVLVTVVGNPLRGGLGHTWDQGERLALAAVALVAWLAWLGCCTQLTRSVIAQVRQGHVSTAAGAVLTERVAARIAAGVLSLIALATPLALASGAGAASVVSTTASNHANPVPQPEPASVAVPPVRLDAPTAATVATPTTTAAAAAAAASYVVQPGDTLWSIAETHLGAGDDWPAIAALNLGRAMPGGLQFVDPSRIYAGWSLQLPALSPAPASDPPVAAATAPATSTPASTSEPVKATSGSAPDGAAAAPDVTQRPEPVVRPVVTLRPTAAPASIRPESGAGSPDGAGPGHVSLPELSALGIGALACAALARRSRRMRVLRQIAMVESDQDDDMALTHSDDAIDADILLHRFSGVPALEVFEAANNVLAQAFAGAGADIRAICVGAAGVDFWLAEPGTPAPTGCTLSTDGQAWRAVHDSLAAISDDETWPFFPIVLPVGEDEAGTWLIPLAPGRCLPLVGEASGDLWRAARRAQEAWSWAEMVLITDDPAIVSRELRLHDDGEGGQRVRHAPPILFFGDPSLLSRAHAREVSIVTQSLAPGSDVTVLVDRHAASIHPLGRTVRPHLLEMRTAELLDELVAEPIGLTMSIGLDRRDDFESKRGPADDDDVTSLFGAMPEPGAMPESMPEAMPESEPVPSPGAVLVKLLTSTPRLEGLHTALPTNRARRATELVAYLALHNGEEVTSDRLRTRVLGSSDADAASKTLFNIAAAARRAMGFDADGTALFPTGSRTGLYRISEGVSVDVHQAAALAAAGSEMEDPEEAMELLRTALSLVEGEPMANALSGYAWWEAEGHGARIAAVLVNAASNLAALAVDAGRFELAQWGLDQARLLDPYSEAISRVAMQVAAEAGDADRLRREWRECQRRIDELDPGSTPSPRTERLYGELARRVLVGVIGDTGVEI
jgi:DNA-binding SARP family transcriptional activator